MHTRALLSMLCIFLVSASANAQTVWHVNDDGDPENGCTSWEDACRELQTALSLAAAGNQIWVAEGTYRPDYDVKVGQHTGNREASFQLINAVGVYGGFNGTEETLEARAGLFDQTILTGDLDGNDTPVACTEDSPDCDLFGGRCIDGCCIIAQDNDENSYHVVTGIGLGTTAILDGFVTTGGNAKDKPPHRQGGGMYNIGVSSPTVSNCIFSGNTAIHGGGMYNNSGSNPTVTNCTFSRNAAAPGSGGGMFNKDSRPTLTDCTFSGNAASADGGGMYNFIFSSPTVTNCTFSGNATGSGGGGMYNFVYSSPTVTNCTFSANTAHRGGGMRNEDSSNPSVTNCTFRENVANFGGGMRNEDSSPTVTTCTFSGNSANRGGGMCNTNGSSPTVSNCMFSENWAAVGGGGLVIEDGSLTVTHCTFRANSTLFGGGMAIGFSSSTVSKCTFSGNAGDFGGGIFINGGNTAVTNCTFSGNIATRGGGMFNSDNNPTVTNCTFSGNDADNGRALAFDSFQQQGPSDLSMYNCILWDGGGEVWNNDNSMINIAYSDVQGGWAGEGNIDLDPLFVESGFWDDDGTPGILEDDFWVEGDDRLLPGSPCIDAADNTAVPADIVTDLDGNPRFVDDPATPDTGNPDGINPIVDMGAYEFNCVDDDGDGRVTICHIPPGNPSNARTMAVNVRALPAHLAHGDSCGPCEDDGDSTKEIASETPDDSASRASDLRITADTAVAHNLH